MTGLRLFLAAATGLAGVMLFPAFGLAQKVIFIHPAKHGPKASQPVRHDREARKFNTGFGVRSVRKHGKARAGKRGHAKHRHSGPRSHIAYGVHRHAGGAKRFHHRGYGRFKAFAGFAVPDQHLYPPYYRSYRPAPKESLARSRITGGKTVRQGSIWRGTIHGGPTVEQGSRYRSHLAGAPTVRKGSVWGGRMTGGFTVRQGSRWASPRPNWRFSGYAAPVRPKGLAYFRAKPIRSALPRQRLKVRGPVVRGARYRGRRY